MQNLSEQEILQTFNLITQYYEKYLKDYGIKPTKLKNTNGQYTKDALVLAYLARNYPNTRAVSKAQLTDFIRAFYPDVSDVQQARHLSKQGGFYIISGTRGDIGVKIPAGHYQLITLEKPYPSFKPDRRSGIESADFEELKKEYDYKCATCGSIEGEPHNIRKNEKTILQEGHMNPSLPLEIGNIIPQCQVCNRPDRDRWIYDKTGRVIEIVDSDDGKRVVEKYFKRVSTNTKEYFLEFLKKLLKLK
ncbi:hypothetical protein OQH60_03665 [Campylobacter sp. MIT 21-1685]|uniref:hypothetical protein n=1 Tax=unclassified Campylobacter TaxID=2593542 RepID=UPI00224B54D0|nr:MULTISPECIES: hypothetical protein [unclassified Campylobacter]MCX2682959.1 hypothetical protein [Campylobacter sp. MIT 21-1684]MCX2751241.1 hypothetical protein [Campylobacter sp. MIT 21-1682]MCX2807440.1 hypothetical protein [Campylobacter sp. MIT 21-1685]